MNLLDPPQAFLGSFRPHTRTEACAEVSESWLWSSCLRQLFILQPSEALKPRRDVSRLLAPVCPHSQFYNTNPSSESISYQLYIYFFPHKSFPAACIIELSVRTVRPSFHPSSHHSPPYTHPGADFFFFFFFPQPQNFSPLPSWRSAVQWLEQENVRSSYINI